MTVTGLDKILTKNINHTRLFRHVNLFTLFGIGNGIGYGLSLVMSKENHTYYFGYKGNGRITDMVRSLFGSNNIANAAWTVPSLLVLGQVLQKQVGAVKMLKYSTMSIFGVCAAMSAFAPKDPWNPHTGFANVRPLAAFLPKWDCNVNDKYYMGSD